MTRWVPSAAHPHGVELVDHVIGLDPNYPLWTTNMFSYAYFMAGRYEDALKMQARMEPNSYNPAKWSMRCGSLAALGRSADTKLCISEALALSGIDHRSHGQRARLQRPGTPASRRDHATRWLPGLRQT